MNSQQKAIDDMINSYDEAYENSKAFLNKELERMKNVFDKMKDSLQKIKNA